MSAAVGAHKGHSRGQRSAAECTCSSSQRRVLHAGSQPARDIVQLALLLLPYQGPESLQQGQSHVAVCQRQAVTDLQQVSAAAAAPGGCQLDCSD